MLCRSNVLERFAVMNAQLHSITAQIVPLLEHYVVYPKVSDMQQVQQLDPAALAVIYNGCLSQRLSQILATQVY